MTLRDMMKTTPLRKARLLAGEKGLDAEVVEGNIVEVPDTVRWMRGGEIVFSSGYAFQGDGQQGSQLLIDLKEHGITALALKPGKYLPEIPAEMIERAEELNFPLLEIPGDMPYSVCLEAIFEQLKAQRITELRTITNLQSMLLDASAKGGVRKICEILQERMGRHVALWNQDWSLRYGEDIQKELAGRLCTCVVDRPTQIHTDHGEMLFCLPLYTTLQNPQAYLTIWCVETELTQGEEAIVQYAASLLSMELLKEEELAQQYMRLNGTLLDCLLEGRTLDPAILHRQAAPYQIDLTSPYVVFACRSTGNAALSRMELWQLLLRRTKALQAGVLLTEKSNCFVGAFFFPEEMAGAEKAVFTQAAEEKDGSVLFGLSRIGRGLTAFLELAREAEEALRVLCRVPGFSRAARLSDLGIYRIFTELHDSEAMQDLVEQTLGPILRYDAEMKGDLLQTLQMYFSNGNNLRRTADAMFLHKNSISYRLHKAEDLTGRSLTDPQFSLELQFCLKFFALMAPCSKDTMPGV